MQISAVLKVNTELPMKGNVTSFSPREHGAVLIRKCAINPLLITQHTIGLPFCATIYEVDIFKLQNKVIVTILGT